MENLAQQLRPKRNPFRPVALFANRVFLNLSSALPLPGNAPPQTLSCSTRPSCSPESVSWLSMLLQALVPPAHAARKVPLLDSIMTNLDPLVPSDVSPLRYPAADRIIAVGDVHGDLDAMREALRNASLIDQEDSWIGGKSVLVQVGDQLDRGHREREIYDLLFRLQDSAPQAGGAVHILLGNHELMNTRLDFRYVTKGGFQDFDRDGGVRSVSGIRRKPQIPLEIARSIKALPGGMRARARALCSGGPLAMELAERAKVSVIIGDNIFVHGGLQPKHLTYGGGDPRDAEQTLHNLNMDTRAFLLGKASYPMILRGRNSPVWMRDYSRPSTKNGSPECRVLAETLRMIRTKRMIVGHTPQNGINSACGGKVWRIDTGMSSAYGGVPEAIEISRRGNIKIHTRKGTVQGSARYQ